MDMNLPIHGGDLFAAEQRWGKQRKGWLDLSTGINPWAYPLPRISAQSWRRLPGRAEMNALHEAAASAYGCPADQVLSAPGTSALIQSLPRLRAFGRAAVIGPTYGEHLRAWNDAGHAVVEAGNLAIAQGADVVVVVNPNNPDGRVFARGALLELADDMHRRGGLLVVDEAFCDVAPEHSVAGDLRPGLAVLRSFGKFYGLAGLRLGFCLAMPDLLAQLARQLGPWAVSGPALTIGTRALTDHVWAAASRAHLVNSAARLDEVLEQAGLKIIGGTSLFRLASHAEAPSIYEQLGQSGILARAFPGRPQLLRFGLPAGSAPLKRLGRALAA